MTSRLGDDAILELGPDGVCRSAKPSAASLLGHPAGALVGRRLDDLVHPDDGGHVRRLVDELLSGERESFRVQARLVGADGEVRETDLLVVALGDGEGGPRRAVAVARGVARGRGIAAQLESSREQLETIFRSSPLGMVVAGADRRLVEANPAAHRILGYEDGELIGASVPDLIHPDDRDIDADRFAQLIAGQIDGYRVEKRYLRKDGGMVWGRGHVSLVHGPDGRPYALGMIEDVTEERRARDALRDTAERYRAIVRTAIDGFAIVDRDGRLLEVNDAYCEMLGYPREELLRMRLPDIGVAEPELRSRFEHLRRVRHDRYEGRHRRKDGAVIDVEVSANVHDDGGKDRYAMFVRDVTERKRLQAERSRLLSHLVAAHEEERMRIAGDVHDDPVQKMVAVDMRLALLRPYIREAEGLEALERLQGDVETAIASLRRLLFDLRPASLDQAGLVAAIQQFVDRSGMEGTRVRIEDELTAEPSPEVRIIAFRICQEALTNVRKHASASRVRIRVRDRDGELLVRIRDDGVGFDPAHANAPTPGHLGLPSIRERAELAGGWARITSAAGRGTTVEFGLPMDPNAPPPPSRRRGSATRS